MLASAFSCSVSFSSASEIISNNDDFMLLFFLLHFFLSFSSRPGRDHIKMSRFGISNDVIVQELCESRGGRPGLSVLTSLLVSVDVKIYCTVLRHWSQLVPNMSHEI